MTKPVPELSLSRSRGLLILEYVLLALCLCVIACRATIAEGLTCILYAGKTIFPTVAYNVICSMVLIFSVLVWLLFGLFRRHFAYRSSGIEFGFSIFILGALLSIYVAENKRLAVIDFALLSGAILMALLLVQLLDSPARIKLVLYVVVALGAAGAYECTYQFFCGNQMMIAQYEQAPNTMLDRLGIISGSYQHMLFEHQLYSKDVRGFFTTGNSAGSFALLSLSAALALFLEKYKNMKPGLDDITILIGRGILVAFISFGLVLTRSKGAILATIVALLLFTVYLLFGRWLKRYRKIILVVCIFLVVAGVCVITAYGLGHGRLPGGNSMLVRWQYWTGAVKLWADHPLTGVGGGNFADFYPHYKIAAAPETVRAPHNFVLSLLSQYGPVGLIGFLGAVFIPFCMIMRGEGNITASKGPCIQHKFRAIISFFMLAIAAVLLVVRPMVLSAELGNETAVMVYVAILLFIVPVIIFIASFLLLSISQSQSSLDSTSQAALLCGLTGVLVHNCIDFAIFEPGVFTTFWAIMACLIALDFYQRPRPKFVLTPSPFVRIMVVSAALAMVWAYLNYVFIPVAKSTPKIQRAQLVVSEGKFKQANSLLAAASKADFLSPVASSLNGQMYLKRFYDSGLRREDLLLRSQECLLEAIRRNKADFANYEKLCKVYSLLAETSTRQSKTYWLNKAFDSALLAVEYYPGSARLRIKLAKIAERLGKSGYACEQYKKAIEIEDSFRVQFRIMYPDRVIFSRLGEEKYQYARQRIKELSR